VGLQAELAAEVPRLIAMAREPFRPLLSLIRTVSVQTAEIRQGLGERHIYNCWRQKIDHRWPSEIFIGLMDFLHPAAGGRPDCLRIDKSMASLPQDSVIRRRLLLATSTQRGPNGEF